MTTSATAAATNNPMRNNSDAQGCFPEGLAHRILSFIAAP
jgi:hypothetical protein